MSKRESYSNRETSSFKIIPLTTAQVDRFKWIKEPLPKPPFRMMCYGNSTSGKTTAMFNLVLRFLVNPKTKLNVFDHIFIFSPSVMTDPTYVSVLNSEELINPDIMYVSDILEKPLIDWLLTGSPPHQKYSQELDVQKGDNTLVIIDDFASDKKALSDEIIYSLFMRGRHYGISTIIMTQYYTQIPIAVRNQCSHMMLFRPRTGKEAQIIKQDQETPELNGEAWDEVYGECTDEKYSFMLIDKSGNQTQYYKRFEYKVKIPEKQKRIVNEEEEVAYATRELETRQSQAKEDVNEKNVESQNENV